MNSYIVHVNQPVRTKTRLQEFRLPKLAKRKKKQPQTYGLFQKRNCLKNSTLSLENQLVSKQILYGHI